MDPNLPSVNRPPARADSGHKNGRDEATEEILVTLQEPGAAGSGAARPALPGGRRGAGPTVATPATHRPVRRLRRTWSGWERISRLALAFTIASLLWFYVLNLENPGASATFTRIPVTTRGLANNLSPSNDLGTVTVTIQAPQDVLAQRHSSDFQAYVDLSGRGPGTYEVSVQIAGPIAGLGVTVEPAQIQVQVDEISEKSFPVQVRTVGVPGLGYRIDTKQVRPSDVQVQGSRDAVGRIDQVVAEVDVGGRQGTQQGDVQPRALDFAGHTITGITFKPQSVAVVIAIQQLLNYKTLPVHVPVEGAPAPGYGVTDIVVQPTTFTAYGSPSVLEPLNFLETAPVSINGATQSVQISATLLLTRSLTLYPPGTPNRVQVRVEIQELSTKTQLSVQVRRIGLAPGLVAVESPDRVDITVSGPFDALQNLKPDSIAAVIDLTGYTVGTYKLVPAIALPPRTEVKGIDPPDVTVTISGPATATPEPTGTATPLPTAPLATFPAYPGAPTAPAFVPPGSPTAEPPILPPATEYPTATVLMTATPAGSASLSPAPGPTAPAAGPAPATPAQGLRPGPTGSPTPLPAGAGRARAP